MAEYIIEDFENLHHVLERFRAQKTYIFRGHADASWALLPRAGRQPFAGITDAAVFAAWKRRALEYVHGIVESDWDWLAIAQHHGLATRLLDWTSLPLNAAFFAVREDRPGPAVVYAMRTEHVIFSGVDDPMLYGRFAAFRPRGVIPRIIRQFGLFTIHPQPSKPVTEFHPGVEELHHIIIAEEYRSTLMRQLAYYGISSATLFPDLDGLSEFVNWTVSSREYWRAGGEEVTE